MFDTWNNNNGRGNDAGNSKSDIIASATDIGNAEGIITNGEGAILGKSRKSARDNICGIIIDDGEYITNSKKLTRCNS